MTAAVKTNVDEIGAYHSSLPWDMPPGWEIRYIMPEIEGATWFRSDGTLKVMRDVSMKADGRRWIHVSVSHRKRLPKYEEMTYVKRHWIGPERSAYMVFAAAARHVNLHPFCLHLWALESGDALPEFSEEVKPGLRTI